MTKKRKQGGMVFSCDMILPITHIANWKKSYDDIQILIKKNNLQENTKSIEYDYKVNNLVLV